MVIIFDLIFELLSCLACDRNYHDEKLCDVSKADCIVQDCILFSKLLEVSEVFLSFTFIFKSKLLCMLHFMSHKKQSSEIPNGDAIAYGKNSNSGHAVKLQVKFPAEKNTLNICRH